MAEWAKTEQDMKRNEIKKQLDDELHPRRHGLHKCFICISFVTCLSAVLMGLGQVIGMFVDKQGPIQWVMRFYVIVLCCLVVMNELEWTRLTRDSTILRVWITRGFLYAFVGVLGLDQNSTNAAASNAASSVPSAAATVYFGVVAWFILLCGMLYSLMGVCCLQLAQDRMRATYQAKQDRAKETERTTFLYGGATGGGGPSTAAAVGNTTPAAENVI
jgi:hypothetical protein